MTKNITIDDIDSLIHQAEARMKAQPDNFQLKYDFVRLLFENGREFSALSLLDRIDEKAFSSDSFRLRGELYIHTLKTFCNPNHPHYSQSLDQALNEKLEGAFFLDAQCAFDLRNQFLEHQEEQLSIYFLVRSAKLGNADAQATLGYYYSIGFHLGQDNRLAFMWTQKAARQNNAIGLNNLGTLYNEGLGVKRSASLAFSLMMKSIELGCTASYGDVGLLLYLGDGVPEDKNHAYQLWLKGSELGSDGCDEYLQTYFPNH